MAEHSRIEEFIDDITLELGGLDILINNAGTNMDNLSLRMKIEEWKKVIENYSEVSCAKPQDDIPITNFDIDSLFKL